MIRSQSLASPTRFEHRCRLKTVQSHPINNAAHFHHVIQDFTKQGFTIETSIPETLWRLNARVLIDLLDLDH
mgnify:CR=1 FL=1